MTETEAAKILSAMMIVLQRFRSITREELLNGGWPAPVVERVLTDLFPWVNGPNCPIPAIQKTLDRFEQTGELDGSFLYNMMTVAHNLNSGIIADVASFMGHKFPQPSIRWNMGLE